MSTFKLVTPCHFGLESVLSGEIKRLDAQNVTVTDGKVTFTGDDYMIARANINLRTAERVLIELATFKATSFEELFQGASTIPIEQLIASKDAFPVKGWSLHSKLFSVPDCQSIIKKALVKRMQNHYGVEWLPETGITYQIQFSILNDEVSIMLDTSGAGLHKRGYRANANAAPIKETLAAGIIDLSRARIAKTFCDPFCGSGTLLIEAATRAFNIPPCLKRKFSAQNYAFLDENIWKTERARGLDLINKSADFMGYGFDIDEEAVELTKHNAKEAGVFSKVYVAQKSIADFDRNEALVCCNPPYGERMLEQSQAEDIYCLMGKSLNKVKNLYVITPSEKFESLFGKKASKKRKLYNGMIKCQLYMYY
ncbi:MAG: class I SAM-dependent RNA methyltransferase [Oscillospiraceae bacterium]